ncbi:nonribosomal peptide synthetase 12 [Multifurca ochricompacta]|uniref:Nonribosomal peptide synthetase 12 n=1 Tax=Multifurca ochricompacta TaxID=376703 RepID=A0AAD4QQ90_9AGAM|nr:nonribosomal peptide synthetase 12 [Multifurca ochricompacta]
MADSLSPRDQRLFGEFSFGERRDRPFQCVHHAFEHHAATHPDHTAVEHLNSKMSYYELDQSANILASRLRSMGVQSGSRVCLLTQRSLIMVIGIVAIMKAGGAYVPLDGGMTTQSTLEHIIKDSRSTLILTSSEFRRRVEDTGVPVLLLDGFMIRNSTTIDAKPQDLCHPSDTVYLIYTSGTTGKPKGVEVTHANVTNLVCLSPGNIGMCPGRRVTQLMNIGFDMAAWEILGSLSNGCTLCIRGKSSKEWRELLKTVDIVIATPSMMMPHNPKDYPNIKVVATAGEACPQSLADDWAECATFYNCCGPTEVTIVNTVQPHTRGSALSIGRPTPNNNVYVLDEDANPLPIGQMGMMWAGGACVTRGYLNLPDKTAERYKVDPFSGDRSFMFNTGDLGRWRPDGTLEHLGRVDDQVKIKGFRVELDGVAAAMETSPEVKVAVALLIEAELWGFVTPATVSIDNVIATASRVQPHYAVPTRLLALAEFPYTTNNKIDKQALRRLALNERRTEIRIVNAGKDNHLPATVSFTPRVDDSLSGNIFTDVSVTLKIPPAIHKGFTSHGVIYPEIWPAEAGGPTSKIVFSEITGVPLSMLEKGNPWDGHEHDVLPQKRQGTYIRNLRHQVFTLYRRLFGVVFAVNMSIFIAILCRGGESAQFLGLVVVANISCCIFMRQDYVINTFFNVFCAVPLSWSLYIRSICARVYHIGGLHSGCAISGVVWLVLFTVQATRELLNVGPTSLPTVVVTYCILLLLLGIVIYAIPTLRSKHHNRFEATHRFLGWIATILVWCQVILLTNDYKRPDQSLGHALLHAVPFWLTLFMTISIILPWTRLRKVPVRAVVLSSHAVRLYFDYATPVAGSFVRISDSPLMEWHGFATIPEPGKPGFSLIVSKAGDWTSKQIVNPPKKIWVRGIPTLGVLRIVPLFRRLVFVATGSGIGPCAPCILEQRVPIQLLWTSPNVRQTFGDELVDAILEKSPGAVIYDTRVHGKPDMVKLTHRLVREFKAEAVCVISNQKLTQKIVYGMVSRGIPAFGAIWDS